ncbi:MAG TPA: NrsF family protein [Polyangiaceae bacterium]
MGPAADLRSRVLSAVANSPAPTRAATRLRNTILFVSGFVVPVAIFWAYGGMRESPRPGTLIAETSAGAGLVALTAMIIALSRGRSMLGRAGTWLLGLALVTPLVLFAWKVLVSSSYPEMTVVWPERPGFRCLRLSCLMAAWPLVAFVMTRRGTDPTHPRLTGAAIGAAVGAAVWVLVDLWCPVAYVPHVLLGHVLPLLLTTAAGTWLGGNVVALRHH